MTFYNPNLDLINVYMYTKFGLILFIHFQDIEWKQKSDINQEPELCYRFAKKNALQFQPRSCIQNLAKLCPFVLQILSRKEILKSNEGHNSVINLQKMTLYNLNRMKTV